MSEYTIHVREDVGWAVHEMNVQRLLAQDYPPKTMDLQTKISGFNAGEKFSESMPEGKPRESSDQMTTLHSTSYSTRTG